MYELLMINDCFDVNSVGFTTRNGRLAS